MNGNQSSVSVVIGACKPTEIGHMVVLKVKHPPITSSNIQQHSATAAAVSMSRFYVAQESYLWPFEAFPLSVKWCFLR